ncbi:MAG TPA: FlgD immunoglobulin-like domain containing protein [Candidatus Eisenbacteria bacterium]|nr:FlgD immunoglobulin-like domain containing protein [Candidatus Eisenbacteria bacterium]
MALRAILSQRSSTFRKSRLPIVLLIAAALLGSAPAFGTVLSIGPSPLQPTTCDSVAVVVKGELPGPCASIASVDLKGPVLLPTAGPIPEYAVRVQIVVRDANPLLGAAACPLTPVPYERVLRLPYHPSGQYHAVAKEYVVPYFSLGVPSGTDTTRVESNFTVSPDTCKATSCYVLDFHRTLASIGICDAGGAPGDTECVEIALGNWEPVAGVQSAIHAVDLRSDPSVLLSGDILRPIRARAMGRADGFRVSWTADESTIKFMLYSDTGAAIPAGIGPVLRVCYAIGQGAAPGPYFLRFNDTVVSDPTGTAVPPCPTFAEPMGRFCVGQPPCDLDGNGRSNVLDIIRLVRCALADSSLCPDSVKTHADCNDDGAVDIRDVICCVRKMLRFGFSHIDEPKTGGATRIGFNGPVEWSSEGQGTVALRVEPGSDFGGLSFGISPAPGTTIRDLAVPVDAGYQVDFDGSDPQMSRFMIVRLTDAAPALPLSFTLSFDGAPAGVPQGAEIKLVDPQTGSWSGSASRTEVTSGIALVPTGAPSPRVYPARPNPFSSATDIAYELPAAKHVTLRVYSATGKLVRTLVDATVPQGVHRAPWNGRDGAGRVVGSGIYFVKLSDGTAESTIRIVRLR